VFPEGSFPPALPFVGSGRILAAVG
jgi:hypothetical protein